MYTYPSPNNFPWPPKAIQIIQRGIALGKSYSEIAEALSIEYGCTITADAVSSKANRDLRKKAGDQQ